MGFGASGSAVKATRRLYGTVSLTVHKLMPKAALKELGLCKLGVWGKV